MLFTVTYKIVPVVVPHGSIRTDRICIDLKDDSMTLTGSDSNISIRTVIVPGELNNLDIESIIEYEDNRYVNLYAKTMIIKIKPIILIFFLLYLLIFLTTR